MSRDTSRSTGAEVGILIPDDSTTERSPTALLSFSNTVTASTPPIEIEREEYECEKEKKWTRKSFDDHKSKRKDTTTSFSSFLHRFTRSDDKKEDKQKHFIHEEDEIQGTDKLLISDSEEKWFEMKTIGMDGFETISDFGYEGGASSYEWKAETSKKFPNSDLKSIHRELLRVEHCDPDLDDLERSMLKLLEEFRSGQMRSLSDEQMMNMRTMKKEHEDVTNLHLALYNLDKSGCEKSEEELDVLYDKLSQKLLRKWTKLNRMSAIIAKLFTDAPSIDGLLKIINEIPEGDESAPEKIAEIARKYKDVFEKKPGEVEHFLTNCNSRNGSTAMMVAIKALYDNSISKNNEQGADRAVEYLKHFIESGSMVAEHLKLIPDIVFPLIRNAPRIGLDLALSAMQLLVDPNEGVVSSLHSALFAVCIRLNIVDIALPYIYRNVTGLMNENIAHTSESSIDPAPQARKQRSVLSQASVCFESKYMLLYLYYGALLLMRCNELRRAISLLESAILIPGSATTVVQLDALKKFYLASLLHSRKVTVPSGRSSALTRAWKLVGEPYTALASAAQCSGDKASAVEKVLNEKKKKFLEDGAVGLITRIIRELRHAAVLSVAKSFSSIPLADLAYRSYVDNDAAVEIMEILFKQGKLLAEISISEGIVRLEVLPEKINSDDIISKFERLNILRQEMERMDAVAQVHPILLQRCVKSASLIPYSFTNNDDEGLDDLNVGKPVVLYLSFILRRGFLKLFISTGRLSNCMKANILFHFTMPYMLISTQIRLEVGPTFVGDSNSDKELMERLWAKPSQQLGNEFVEYMTPLAPRQVLNILENEGWKVVQTSTLVKIAAGGFVFGSTSLYLAQKYMQLKVRRLPHFSESLEIIAGHSRAKDTLGVPIQVGSVNFADRAHNFVGKNMSMLRIPVAGSISCGFLDIVALRESETSPFKVAKIRLIMEDSVISVYDTGEWKDAYLLWLFLPIIIVFVFPIFLVLFIYGCVIFLHVYGLRHQIREAYNTSYWNGARIAITSFWDAVGHVWHG
ncbi:putative GTP cyclohydrolase I feedback regulatory protein [Dictyocaulus viviparus]|uniref:GTP cyclohydrolase 1 feedback regulatory protein n=1 Tax=Dictyocaulus viviparus TaxID=29172 RepID=A0A0D8XTU8_DICVI|nr:putative GTP cyclohydrolase I feedback regulatory protein [Dictyocaulus viviparus]